MTRTSFRSKLDKELYAIIKDEAYRMEIPVSDHISNIVSAYAESKRKERGDASDKVKSAVRESREPKPRRKTN